MLRRRSFARPLRLSVVRLAAAAVAMLIVFPAAARPLEVVTAPDHATWQDSIEVTVSGMVETACGPEVMTLSVESTTPEAIVLALHEEFCPLPTLPELHPFAVSIDLPPLVPRHYTLVVRDLADGTQTDRPLEVLEVSPFELVVPENVASDEVAVLQVRGWATCPSAAAELVDGVIEGFYGGSCDILSGNHPQVFTLDVPVGPLPSGVYPIHLLDVQNANRFDVFSLMRGTLRVWDASGCVPSTSVLCLQDGRFRVEVAWIDFQGNSGQGRPIPLPDRDDSGLFWFFDPANIELTVKVLDACALNDHFWVFVASGSTVGYTITVTDTRAGVARTYDNALGSVPSLLPDTAAFATCP